MPQYVRSGHPYRALQMALGGVFQCQPERLGVGGAAALGGEQRSPRGLEVVVELTTHLRDPPFQQYPGSPEHRHQPLARPGTSSSLAITDVDLAQRTMVEVQVVQRQDTAFRGPQSHLGGHPRHRVVPARELPLPHPRESVSPSGEEPSQVHGRRRDPLGDSPLLTGRFTASIGFVTTCPVNWWISPW